MGIMRGLVQGLREFSMKDGQKMLSFRVLFPGFYVSCFTRPRSDLKEGCEVGIELSFENRKNETLVRGKVVEIY